MHRKSTTDEIRARFDADVERFSNLETGQQAAVDAALALDLVTRAAAATTPHARDVLDVGCGAGNFALRLLQRLPAARVTLVDLSRPMLDRAEQRIAAAQGVVSKSCQDDVRNVEFEDGQFDVVLAGAVLHHLREDQQWRDTFSRIHRWLRPNGSFWIYDMVSAAHPQVHRMQWERYGEYLESVRDGAYRNDVFTYIEREDTPRSLAYQLQLLREVGFAEVDVLHYNISFAAFGGVKRSDPQLPNQADG